MVAKSCGMSTEVAQGCFLLCLFCTPTCKRVQYGTTFQKSDCTKDLRSRKADSMAGKTARVQCFYFFCESHWLPYCLLAQTIPEGMQNSLLKIKNRGNIIVGNLCTKIHRGMRDTKAPGHLDGKTFPLKVFKACSPGALCTSPGPPCSPTADSSCAPFSLGPQPPLHWVKISHSLVLQPGLS